MGYMMLKPKSTNYRQFFEQIISRYIWRMSCMALKRENTFLKYEDEINIKSHLMYEQK
jgi:hypothetical protein